jgi:hypothetical protein
MAATRKKKPAAKRKKGGSRQKNKLPGSVRRWSLPLLLFLFLCFSLAATFYLVFFYIPPPPVY